ncbi:bacteriophage abortive infection AbiH family protein [Polaribacter undariae]|uniref:Bacteriophage abortive infection AbiH family protein n=1 Tax=Polaribacter sejongensis TaxID=985043 RepID=A0AAJ1QZ02_9FLAO|nr:bacteriophage abortive infection AbiH family protein [Polaribacter undariae]MDN3620417.1 bacteriophage abortive infection AbiH family protein [Polaribacter undariae]UWD32816.1 bacteriophage abortive infection AbiH family protein [Polaribacter undariae]
MANLIILGNGFDMAHGLKTSYKDFILEIINSSIKKELSYKKIVSIVDGINNYDHLLSLIKKSGMDTLLKSDNDFFKELLNLNINKNWYEIEQLYFNTINEISGVNYSKYNSQNIEKLNTEFEILKKYLEAYLTKQESNLRTYDSYKHLFKYFTLVPDTLILNFNYTETINNYQSFFEIKPTIINIHGKLNDNENPIIFGYAANEKETRNLINMNNNLYLKNIKKHCYKRTSNENKLNDYLNSNTGINIYILGHSCGLSDKLILNQIFNHKSINSIKNFYHKNYDNYFQTQVNIDRIMENDNYFKKLQNYSDSLKMPQYNYTKEQINTFEKSFRLKSL